MRALIVGGLAATIGLSSPALAWGDKGHMTVAAVAWEELDGKSKAYVTELLKLNPQYPEWVRGISEADQPKIAFMRAATWPDVYVRKYKKKEGDGVDKPHANENIGYADPWMRKYWHFKNISYTVGNVAALDEVTPNAVTRIKDFSAALKNKSLSADIRSYDLTWLIHLVGDLHQPLHAVARVTPQNRTGDHGGNSVAVCDRTCKPDFDDNQTLHSFWDNAIGSSRKPEAAITYADMLIKAKPTFGTNTDPDQWATESYELAKKFVYIPPIGPKAYKAYVMTDDYRKTAAVEANKRIYAAGVRLSNLIEANTPN